MGVCMQAGSQWDVDCSNGKQACGFNIADVDFSHMKSGKWCVICLCAWSTFIRGRIFFFVLSSSTGSFYVTV